MLLVEILSPSTCQGDRAMAPKEDHATGYRRADDSKDPCAISKNVSVHVGRQPTDNHSLLYRLEPLSMTT